jgi:hypothetical protein
MTSTSADGKGVFFSRSVQGEGWEQSVPRWESYDRESRSLKPWKGRESKGKQGTETKGTPRGSKRRPGLPATCANGPL